ncbi:MAG: GH92 family glycosyl hydrolase [Bacteroidales bacterium]|nr:GH92 family glycosyl hydrolase [Bacteroidales bacterium]
MNKKVLVFTASILLWGWTGLYGQACASYVNTFIGTNGMGHTFPGACYPYGAIQLSPDTDTIPHNIGGVYQPRAYEYCTGYQYRDKSIVGFSHTHFSGTGHSDLGDFLVMPFTGKVKLNPGTADNPDAGYRQRFRHETETSRPGYYAVTLDDDHIRCELTASPHVGAHRYVFTPGDTQKILLDLHHAIYNYEGKVLWAQANVLENGRLLQGYRITSGWSRTNYTYFAIRFSKPIVRYGCKDFGRMDYKGFWKRFDVNHDFPEMGGRELVTWFEFAPEGGDTLEIYLGISSVSMQGALKNLETETAAFRANPKTNLYPHSLFDALRQQAENEWEKRLSVAGAKGSEDAKAMFYTSLYHVMINPSVYQDVDGKYRGIDHEIHQAKDFTNYTIFSVWDTYRALHPLLTLLDPALAKDIVSSFLAHYRQSPHGMLPVWSHMGSENWCMIGYHGVSVVADALEKGLLKGKEAQAVEAMLSSSNVAYYDFTDVYKKLGYVPVDKSANGVSVTLENAYEDWTVFNTLFRQGRKAEASVYRQRALSYRNIFDPSIGFARARYTDGSWKEPFSLLSTYGEGFIEGNAWNYSFYAPHDVFGLMRAMGGEAAFVTKLDTLFTMHIPDAFFAQTEDVTREGMLGGYVQGNEPSHHIPYLYMWTSQPWKTQYWVREIMNKMYRNHMDGLCGNDDCGQMSAWYIFSAMGFYPVCPGSGQYVIGAPYLPYLKIRLANDRVLEIKAPKVSDKNRYIQSVTWNGMPWTRAFLTHRQLADGGVLEFVMGPKPNTKLFQNKSDKPYSLTE